MTQTLYTKEQWDMTNQVMNLVDEQRHGSKTPWSDQDTHKVMELVQRTYRDQGIDVDQAVVEKAMTVALRGLHLQELESQQALTSNVLLDEAKTLIHQVQAHRLYSDYDLMALVQSEGDRLRKNSRRLWFWQAAQTVGLIGTLVVGIRASLASPHPLIMLAIAVGTLAFCGYLVKKFVESGVLISEVGRLVQAQPDALHCLSRATYNSEDARLWARHINPSIGYHAIAPLAENSFWWQQAEEYAQAHPALFKTWGEWLTSRAPIRLCDVMLLQEAAEAVQKAEKFLDYQVNQTQAQAQAKHRMLSGRQ